MEIITDPNGATIEKNPHWCVLEEQNFTRVTAVFPGSTFIWTSMDGEDVYIHNADSNTIHELSYRSYLYQI
jgi:hypothetical protein